MDIQSQVSTLSEAIQSTKLKSIEKKAIHRSILGIQLALLDDDKEVSSNEAPSGEVPKKRKRTSAASAVKGPHASLTTLYAEMRNRYLTTDKAPLLTILTRYQIAKPHLYSAAARQDHIRQVCKNEPTKFNSVNLEIYAGAAIEQLVTLLGPPVCRLLCQKTLLARLKKGPYHERQKFVQDFTADSEEWRKAIESQGNDDGWCDELRNIGFTSGSTPSSDPCSFACVNMTGEEYWSVYDVA